MIEDASPDNPTATGKLLIEKWILPLERMKSLERELNTARKEVDIATKELGEWIMPDDAVLGETIAVWCGNQLIAATKRAGDKYEITIRKRA